MLYGQTEFMLKLRTRAQYVLVTNVRYVKQTEITENDLTFSK